MSGLQSVHDLAGDEQHVGRSLGEEVHDRLAVVRRFECAFLSLERLRARKDDLVLIAAGYPEPMINFLKRFDGISLHLFGTLGCWDEENIFEDRNGNIFKFEDYTSEELYKIFQKLCEKYQYILEPAAERAVKEHFETLYAKRDKCFGNAREVRNFFQDIVSNQAMRMSKIGDLTQKDLMTVILEDIPKPKNT